MRTGIARACVAQLALILLAAACTAASPTATPPPATATLPPAMPTASTEADVFARARRLGRGVNLGNALEAPNEGEWGVMLKESYFDVIREAGFNSVRVPIRWSAHAQNEPPYAIDETFFARVDWVITQATARDLAVVINMHHYDEIFAQPDAHRQRFLAMWEQIARRYQSAPATVLFEPLNEPHDALTARKWNELLADVIATIRATNPDRTLVAGAVNWNNVNSLASLHLPDAEHNVIVTFHYYSPFEFTHQGAEWVAGMDKHLGTTWMGAEAEQRAVQRDLDLATNWARKQKRPLYLGEFGAYGKADMDSRARWTSFIARQAESRGMAWAYWEFAAGFGVYDPQGDAWREPLLTSLVPQK